MPIQQFDTLDLTFRATSYFNKPDPYKHFPAIEITGTAYNESNQSLTEVKISGKYIPENANSYSTPEQAKQQAVVYWSANYESVIQCAIEEIQGTP